MIVTEAQDRELARMPSLEEMNEDFQPSEKFQRKMEALVRDTKRKAERKKRLLNVKRFFITLTAAISIFSCTMLPVKAVREAVITTLIEWHDKFVSIIESQTDYDPLQFDTAFSESDTYNNLLLLDLKRALSTEEYHVIYDHYFRQYSIQEIATRDNKSRQAINKCKKTAIIKLRRYFGVTS